MLERLDVRPQAGDRRAQLVARVGHELALRLHGALQRVERRVEAARQAAELVIAVHVHALGRIGCVGQLLGSPGEAADRRERGARHHRGEPGAERDPGRAHDQQHEQHPVELAVHLVERPRELDRAAAGPRAREHAQVRPRDIGICEGLAGTLTPRDLACARVHRHGLSVAPGRRSTSPDGRTTCTDPSGPPNGSGGGAGKRRAPSPRAPSPGRSAGAIPSAPSPATRLTRFARSRSESSTSPRSCERTPR